MAIDLLIENGTVVDGTGALADPGRSPSSATSCAAGWRGEASGEIGRRIDATGKVVAPGFIDVHSHSGLMILADPRHEPKVRQGVTTEVIGVDGLSYAPTALAGRPRRVVRDERRPGWRAGHRRATGIRSPHTSSGSRAKWPSTSDC